MGGIAYNMFGGTMPVIADFKAITAFKPGVYVPRRFQGDFLKIMINSGFDYGDFYFDKRRLNYDSDICNIYPNDEILNNITNTIDGNKKIIIKFSKKADKWGGGHTNIKGRKTKIYIMKQKYRTIYPDFTVKYKNGEFYKMFEKDGAYDGIINYYTKPTLIQGQFYQTVTSDFDLYQCVECNQSSIFWHELGHHIKPKEPSYAIILENIYRQKMNLELRPLDAKHY